MRLAKFTITYYYKNYTAGDIDKRHSRTAIVYAANLEDAIKKIKDFDGEFISVADGGVCINEIGGGKNESSSNVG
jgi:hypothetical protein